jgi:hypothetical protein
MNPSRAVNVSSTSAVDKRDELSDTPLSNTRPVEMRNSDVTPRC